MGPLWIIVALMVGGELFGFMGVLLAVPTTAVLKVLVGHTLSRYRRSSLFLSTDKSDLVLSPAADSAPGDLERPAVEEANAEPSGTITKAG